MGLINQNFILWKGDDKTIQFTIEDATNVTDFTAKWHLAATPTSTKLITKTSDVGGGITFNANKVLISLESSETDDSVTTIPEGLYYHELELVDDDDKRTIAAIGIVDVRNTRVGRP
jgi:hypothetical protein